MAPSTTDLPQDQESRTLSQLNSRATAARHDSDTSQDTTSDATSTQQHQQHHPPPRNRSHKHLVGAGRVHARVPSTRGLHAKHGAQAGQHHEGGGRGGHRRAHSEGVKPAQQKRYADPLSAESLAREDDVVTEAYAVLRQNKSQFDVRKRNKSSEKLRRTLSNTAVTKLKNRAQVHFDLGTDGQDDEEGDEEWVDASGSGSPYLSRKPSIASEQGGPRESSAATSTLKTTTGADAADEIEDTRDVEATKDQVEEQEKPQPALSEQDIERVQHKEYLTSRLLQRTPSYGSALAQVSKQMASVSAAPLPAGGAKYGTYETPPQTDSQGLELTSRFMGSSEMTSQGSYYNHPRGTPRKSRMSIGSLAQASQQSNLSRPEAELTEDEDDRAFAPPKKARGLLNRTQLKLELQRASSVIEPSQAVTGGVGAVGMGPLVGIGGPGYDGGSSRDPRVGKLLERTGMEYLVVRRYQNPTARSLGRVMQLQVSTAQGKHIPRTGTASSAASTLNGTAAARHPRPMTLQHDESSRPATPTMLRRQGPRSNGIGAVEVEEFEGDGGRHRDEGRVEEGDDKLSVLLRGLWERGTDLSASQD